MQQILSKFFRWLQDVFGIDIEFVDYKTLEYIIYGLLALVVLYVIIKFLINNPVNAVFKTENKPIDNFDYSEEHIEKIDFDNLITKAIEEQNFRLATRFLYLKSLKELSNQKLIEWHFDKTNSDYLNELKNANIKSYFKRISHIYDYIWYGEFPIDEASFKKNESDFLNLIKSVSNG